MATEPSHGIGQPDADILDSVLPPYGGANFPVGVAVDDLGQTLVLVTHDASAAARADRVLFLGDGRIVDEMVDPDADAIFDRVRELGG